jgi:hypothetical protein
MEWLFNCEDCYSYRRIKGILGEDETDCPNFGNLFEVPKGEGWQMWEDTSEGSPISPVFETPEELAQWLTDTKASSFGDMSATYEEWLNMINRGWAPSMVYTSEKGIQSGVADCTKTESEK